MSEITTVPLRPVGRNGVIALWAGIGLLIAVGVGGAYAASQKPVAMAMPPAAFMAANAKKHGVKASASGLEYQVLKPGAGPTPTTADVVQIEYRGTLTSGSEFDASPAGQPVALPVAGVVPGFAEALMLMPRGAKYRVWIPPQLGYGEQEKGPIPANSVLVFDITMHDFMAMPQGMPGMQPPGI